MTSATHQFSLAALLLAAALTFFARTASAGTWSAVYGAWPSDEPRQAAATNICPDGGYATAFSVSRLGHGNGWAAGDTWIGTISMTCSGGSVLTLDAQPDNNSKTRLSVSNRTGFAAASIASGWALDNLFDLAGSNSHEASVFRCPSGSLISGFAGAAVKSPLGWVVDFKLWCSVPVAKSPVARSPSPPPSPPSPVAPRPPIVLGPFGGFNAANAFDDHPSQPITGFVSAAGSWTDSLQVSYGGVPSPRHGGSGGSPGTPFTLAQGEYVVDASVRHGGYVDAIFLTTNLGRKIGLGAAGAGPNGDETWAAPCPIGSYRLTSVRGSASQYLEAVTLVWELIPGKPDGSSAVASNGWTCSAAPGLVQNMLRKSPDGSSQPQCLAKAGSSQCLSVGNCWSLLSCLASSSVAPASPCTPGVTAVKAISGGAPTGSYQDPTNWCPRAQGALGLPVGPAPVPIQAVFILLTVCNSGPPASRTTLQNNVMFTDPNSLKAYWKSISFSRAFFDETTAMIREVTLPCSAFPAPPPKCDFDAWVQYIDAHAAALGVPELPAFKYRRVFVGPDSVSCGAGFQAGNNVYVNGALVSNPSNDLNVFKHEMGHSLGLSHSSKWANNQNDEYGDGSTPMGYCQRCSYAAPHLLSLGWASPVKTLTRLDLTPGVPLTITLPALVDQPINTLVVHIDWTRPANASGGSTRPVGQAPNLFISFRVAKGQDVGLPAQFNRAVSVHSIADGGGNTYLEAALQQGAAWADPTFGLAVAPVSQNGDSVKVKVCRFQSSASECPGF